VRRFAAFAVLTFLFAATAGATVARARCDDAAIAAALQKELDAWRAEVKAPGAIAAVARLDGKPITVASGVARRRPAKPMPLDARIFTGSIGKVIVAAVALQLAEEKVLDLDAPLSKWLGAEPWYGQLPNGDAITLRHLMNHTSGLSEYFNHPGALARLKSDPQGEWTPEERLALVLGRKPQFAAGQGWNYADTNYIALGMVIERATGADFYELAQERVLDPLALSGTTPAIQSEIPGLVSGYTQPNQPFPFPAEVAVDGVYCANPQFEWTGGGFVTTAGDLARLAAALFGSDALLPKSRRDEQTAGVAAQLTPGEQYGLGCTLRDATNGGATGRAIGHSGWFPGYLSDMAWFEGAGVAVAVQVNIDHGMSLVSLHRFLDRAALAVAPLVAETKAPSPPPEANGDDGDRDGAGPDDAEFEQSLPPPEERPATSEPWRSTGGWPPAAAPAELGIDPAAIAALMAQARAAKSDAVVIVVDGKLVAEEYFGLPQDAIEMMSCTKSMISLLVGIAIDDGTIESVDTPVSRWFPEFLDADGGDHDASVRARRANVTLRHLLTHTSGLVPAPGSGKIGTNPDLVAGAIECRVAKPPGTAFAYNNLAVNLAAGILERATGRKADQFARERLFGPLGIVEFGWRRDMAGNPFGMSGCYLHARDLARVGQLVLQRGVWEGKRLVSEKWLDEAMRPAFPELGRGAVCGYLWWLDVFPATETEPSRVRGVRAEGMLGNHLVVIPEKKLVAVRQRRYPTDRSELAQKKYGFPDFAALVRKLVPPR